MGMLTFANAGKKDAARMTTSPRKSVGDATITAGQPVSTVANTPMDAGEFTGTHLSVERRSTGSPTQPGRNSYYAGRVQSPQRGRTKLQVTAFPKDLGISRENTHYMLFKTYNIKGSVGSKSDNSFEELGPSVALPIPGAPAVTYEQGWETDTKGSIKSAIQTGMDALKTGSTNTELSDRAIVTNALGTEYKEATGSLGGLGGIGNLIVKKVLTGNIGVQSEGFAIFDQSFAVYGGPAYRTFSFTFSLLPLSLDDGNTIREIIQFFKVNSAPKQSAANLARIYELPKAFGITYHNRNKENEFMNRIGKCALTNIGVSYGGDKFNVFDGTDVPVQIDLSLAFTELQLQDSGSVDKGF